MKEKTNIHMLGVPHTITSKDYVACAYTQKVLKFGKMFQNHPDYNIIHYGHPDSDLICDELVPVVDPATFEEDYGHEAYKKKFFTFDVEDATYKEYARNATMEIFKRVKAHDIILPFWGAGNRPVCDAVSAIHDVAVIEPGIGYSEGSWAKYKIFESYAMMHCVQTWQHCSHCDPKVWEIVIPNYFDLDEFEYKEEKEDYALFLGRVYEGKGVHFAIETCKALGIKLIIAGQMDEEIEFPENVEYVGYADVETRKRLMSNAKMSFMPSQYLEPFGGVLIENFLSGTPVLSSDWGAFAENNIHGVTGYRCRTYGDYIEGAKLILSGSIKSSDCRKQGELFSLENIKGRYEKFFKDVINEEEDGSGMTELLDRGSILNMS